MAQFKKTVDKSVTFLCQHVITHYRWLIFDRSYIADVLNYEIDDDVTILVHCMQFMGINEDESGAALTPLFETTYLPLNGKTFTLSSVTT